MRCCAALPGSWFFEFERSASALTPARHGTFVPVQTACKPSAVLFLVLGSTHSPFSLMKRCLQLVALLTVLVSLNSCATIGRTMQTMGRTVFGNNDPNVHYH